jgi:hypothetical protein
MSEIFGRQQNGSYDALDAKIKKALETAWI